VKLSSLWASLWHYLLTLMFWTSTYLFNPWIFVLHNEWISHRRNELHLQEHFRVTNIRYCQAKHDVVVRRYKQSILQGIDSFGNYPFCTSKTKKDRNKACLENRSHCLNSWLDTKRLMVSISRWSGSANLLVGRPAGAVSLPCKPNLLQHIPTQPGRAQQGERET
jgi:hypothetical protein